MSNIQFTSESNGAEGSFTNTALCFVIGELHNDDRATGGAGTSPPFAIQLHRDHLQVVAGYCPAGLNPSNRPQSYESDVLDPSRIQFKPVNIAISKYRPMFRTLAVGIARFG
jgi:hypothetical protein